MYKYYLYIVVAGVLSSCYFFKKKEEAPTNESGKEPIARAFDNYLYEEDLKDLYTGEFTKEDSLNLRRKFINSWVRKHVLLEKAERNISSLNEVEKKVEQYRYDLILFEYQRKYLESKLESVVSEKEIKKYYEQNKKNFELKQNIVKCEFARVHKNSPKLSRYKKYFSSSNKKYYTKFKEYVMQYSDIYSFEKDIWYDFNEVVNNTPFATYQNQISFLEKNKTATESDSAFVYFLKIYDYKISDEISPLAFVKNRIADIIVNKRKVRLLKELEEGVYEKAKENNEFEVY